MEQTEGTDQICQFVLLGPGDVVVNITNDNSLETLPDLDDYLASYDVDTGQVPVEKAVSAGASVAGRDMGAEGGRDGWPGTQQVRPGGERRRPKLTTLQYIESLCRSSLC